jgi:phospholipase C
MRNTAHRVTVRRRDAVTRRRFLRLSGAVVAGATTAPWPVARASGNPAPMPDDVGTPLERFDHLVVLMFENRSFDNLLGYLHEPGAVPRGQRFDGVAGRNLANPVPGFVGDGHDIIRVRRGVTTDNPNPDPGEEYPHVNTQLFNQVNPEANRFAAVASMQAPFNAPAQAGQVPTMDGFGSPIAFATYAQLRGYGFSYGPSDGGL